MNNKTFSFPAVCSFLGSRPILDAVHICYTYLSELRKVSQKCGLYAINRCKSEVYIIIKIRFLPHRKRTAFLILRLLLNAFTICTAQWSLYVPHRGHYMHRSVVTICTAQWSLYVPHSGHYMYRTVVTICTTSLTFTNSTFCLHSCIYVFCVDLRTNSDYFPIQH